MKTEISLLLALVKTVLSLPAQQVLHNENSVQLPVELGGKLLPSTWPGFDLDLNARRLVQMEGAESPVWMTELEKVELACISSITRSHSCLGASQSRGEELFRRVIICLVEWNCVLTSP